MRLFCLVDNTVARGSDLWGEHGLSFLIQSPEGHALWDTGQSGTVLEHNLAAMDLAGIPLRALALSHAHLDHTGGLSTLLARYPALPIYAHPAIFDERYSESQGSRRAIGISDRRATLMAQAAFQLSAEPQEIVPGMRTTGTVAPRPFPQGSSPHHLVRRDGDLIPDTYEDDLSLVLSIPRGIVLLCGCCHAGLRNTLALVRRQYEEPLVAVIGGTHLVQADRQELVALAETLRKEGEPLLYLNHCTGEEAIWSLREWFGDRVRPCPAGTVLDLASL